MSDVPGSGSGVVLIMDRHFPGIPFPWSNPDWMLWYCHKDSSLSMMIKILHNFVLHNQSAQKRPGGPCYNYA